jgi:hypothetical protein
MPVLTNAEAETLNALREAAREAIRAAQLIRASEGRSVLKTDLAMRRLYEALALADNVNLFATRRGKR